MGALLVLGNTPVAGESESNIGGCTHVVSRSPANGVNEESTEDKTYTEAEWLAGSHTVGKRTLASAMATPRLECMVTIQLSKNMQKTKYGSYD